MLQVDEQWAVRTDDSCTWWPHDLAQRIATRPITGTTGADQGVLLLLVETDVLRGVPLDYPAIGLVVNELNSANALSALALGEDGVLRLRFSLRVFDDT